LEAAVWENLRDFLEQKNPRNFLMLTPSSMAWRRALPQSLWTGQHGIRDFFSLIFVSNKSRENFLPLNLLLLFPKQFSLLFKQFSLLFKQFSLRSKKEVVGIAGQPPKVSKQFSLWFKQFSILFKHFSLLFKQFSLWFKQLLLFVVQGERMTGEGGKW
jgi:hypothetical protein